MSVYTNGEGEIKIKPEISKYLKKNVSINLEDLEKFSSRVQELAFELYEVHLEIMKQLGKEIA